MERAPAGAFTATEQASEKGNPMPGRWNRRGKVRRAGRALAFGVVVAVAGCASSGARPDADPHGGHDMPAADPHAGHAMPEPEPAAGPAPTDHAHHHHALPATAGDGFTVADVHFMQMMIGHHDQAVRMVALVEGRDAGPEVTTLARRIDISQRDEIVFMERWLRERGQAVPDQAQRRAMEMPGMVTEAQFAEMERARGTAFDRLFLRYMIAHHIGALDMVEELFRAPGAAQDSELFPFVTDVGADQLDEIGIMERILAELDGDAAAHSHHPDGDPSLRLASPEHPTSQRSPRR